MQKKKILKIRMRQILSSKSREKMLMILPTGVESKKDIGLAKTLTKSLSWRVVDARRQVCSYIEKIK